VFSSLVTARNSRCIHEALDSAWHAYWNKAAREEGLLLVASALDNRGHGRAIIDPSACPLGLYEVLADRRPEIGIAILEERAHEVGVSATGQGSIGLVVYGSEVGDVLSPPEAGSARIGQYITCEHAQRRAPRAQWPQAAARPVRGAEEGDMVGLR